MRRKMEVKRYTPADNVNTNNVVNVQEEDHIKEIVCDENSPIMTPTVVINTDVILTTSNKQIILSSLNDDESLLPNIEEMEHLNICEIVDRENCAQMSTWNEMFFRSKKKLSVISEIVTKEERLYKILPLKTDIFNAFKLTPLNKVKVVIFGQDPYTKMFSPRLPVAVGLAFSVRRGDSIPPSLRNIYKELQTDIKGFVIPNHGDISCWCDQGVLLLNTCLTLRLEESNSHKELWIPFVVEAIKVVIETNPSCIFLLWGAKAQKLEQHIGSKNIKLLAPHPAASCYGKAAIIPGRSFFGCKHFSQVNTILEEKGIPTIDWTVR